MYYIGALANPTTGLVVGTTDDPGGVGALVKAFDPNFPPSIFAEQFVDSNVPKHYIIIQKDTKAREAYVFSQLLCILTNPISADKIVSSLKVTFPNSSASVINGDTLSGDPNANPTGREGTINGVYNDLMMKVLGPHLEKQLVELSDIVCAPPSAQCRLHAYIYSFNNRLLPARRGSCKR